MPADLECEQLVGGERHGVPGQVVYDFRDRNAVFSIQSQFEGVIAKCRGGAVDRYRRCADFSARERDRIGRGLS